MNDDGEDPDDQIPIDPALDSLSAGGPKAIEENDCVATQDFLTQFRPTGDQPLHIQLDFYAHQTASDARKAEPKASDAIYLRHVKRYERFIETFNNKNQEDVDPDETLNELNEALEAMEDEGDRIQMKEQIAFLQPFPITAYKAFLFALSEKNRGIGISAVKQVGSALERRRLDDVHLWQGRDEPLLETMLRDYGPIQHLEEHGQINDKNREGTAQSLKVSGSSLEVVTEADLKACSMNLLKRPDTTGAAAFKIARDRAMLLIGSQTGYRGASIRHLQWSDIRYKLIPVQELGTSQDGITQVEVSCSACLNSCRFAER